MVAPAVPHSSITATLPRPKPPAYHSPDLLRNTSTFFLTQLPNTALPPLSMPRPGPRPYECVRRAWHSDRHQPIRGSLIQEIFRVVAEIHCSATKKNKEWQEKLPVVVLRAEEILYSKANSEVEYMDLKTLWERVNDAINTIIRRDENTETGQFLLPCIEAALNLGCTPRRASRSERNSNPTCYLSSTSQKPPTMPPCLAENTAGERPNWSYFSNLSNPNSAPPGLNGQIHVSHTHSCFIDKFFTASETVVPSANTQCFSTQNVPASNLVSVYPLYYGNSSHFEEHQNGFNSNSRPADFTCPGKISSRCIADVNTWGDSHRAGTRYAFGSLCNSWCDLSLRLGPPSIPCLNLEDGHHLARVKEGVMSSPCRKGVSDQSHCMSPWSNENGPSHPIGSFGDKKVVVEEQRADLSQALGGKQLHREPKLLFWQ